MHYFFASNDLEKKIQADQVWSLAWVLNWKGESFALPRQGREVRQPLGYLSLHLSFSAGTDESPLVRGPHCC